MSTSNIDMTQKNADKPGVCQVAILFEEPAINAVFAELIQARGYQTRIISPAQPLLENERLITEPQFLSVCPEEKKLSCLLIGNKDAISNLPGIKLARPLTESKIMQAIDQFLA